MAQLRSFAFEGFVDYLCKRHTPAYNVWDALWSISASQLNIQYHAIFKSMRSAEFSAISRSNDPIPFHTHKEFESDMFDWDTCYNIIISKLNGSKHGLSS
jgi:hypothetical protein